ncbi:charged multivesicular body protein 6-like [Oscarella lobularis]|uniref:charged multivesicular body protein 6-like n=1 Tax=Oscarella lobularis TaxID=121494 RepID=UPI0033132303
MEYARITMGAFFARLFGRGDDRKASRITEQDRAIFELKKQRDKLKQYQKKIVAQLERERNLAKELLKQGKKERAKLLLKKKRYQESLLDKTDKQLNNLEEMAQTLEFTQVEMRVVEGMKQGNQALEAMHKMMSLEDVEKIMDDTQDAIEYQKQIDELLGQNLSQEDEDEVLKELDQLLGVPEPGLKLPEAPDHEIATPIGDRLPEVPDTEISEKKRKETAEPLTA